MESSINNTGNDCLAMIVLQFYSISLPVPRPSGPVEMDPPELTRSAAGRPTKVVCVGEEADVRSYSNRIGRAVC